eukprot:m.35420 g.35420  ORF g.35420 m.35420 type:complete len:820 (-) comp5719_c0_seq1:47-2506(-)
MTGRRSTWNDLHLDELADVLPQLHARRQRASRDTESSTSDVQRGIDKEQKVAILTSGGDAPGMNAALRGAAATCLARGASVFAVHLGYKGLVLGGTHISPLGWLDLEHIMQKGGTIIGSARCLEFRERAVRFKAAKNLLLLGINNLIVIGGDGSLTGANHFRADWPELVDEVVAEGAITAEAAAPLRQLNLVGMVGSIDNDLIGFSMTIGCDTALHRIVKAVDALITTAASHERTFIVEVMGRDCGFLALHAAIACGADWVFLPEHPPDVEAWEDALLLSLAKRRYLNYSLVILAEGATDRVRRPITSEYLLALLSRHHLDTRVTKLGHVQRGGAPSAFDRLLATRCGAEAAESLLASCETAITCPARIVGIRANDIVQLDLEKAVAQTRSVNSALEGRDFAKAKLLRGPVFNEELNLYLRTRRLRVHQEEKSFRVAIFHVGAPAAGMNTAVRVAVRYLLGAGHSVMAVCNGFEGFVADEIRELTWKDVAGWTQLGGAMLGTNRTLPDAEGVKAVVQRITQHKIDALLVIGGFEGFCGIIKLMASRAEHAELSMPMTLVPCSISNNIPGCAASIGSDTALNAIVDSIDRLSQSALSSRRRTFIVETMGGKCGYLAVMGGLAGGADDVYIAEEGVQLGDMQATIEHLRSKFKHKRNQAIIMRNERASEQYTTEFMQLLFEAEGAASPDPECKFSTRNIILGHLQQGRVPSPLDRVRASRLASRGAQALLDCLAKNCGEQGCNQQCQCAVVVEIGDDKVATPIEELEAQTDFRDRVPIQQWFVDFAKLMRSLAKNEHRPSAFPGELAGSPPASMVASSSAS